MGKKHRQRRNGSLPRTGNARGSAKGAVCPYCGKRAYFSRKYAKEANRRLYPNEKMSAYQCTSAPEWVDTSAMWHIGHLAPAVTQGKATRSQVHGSAPVHMAREAPRKPIHPALRAIVVPGSTVNDNDEDDNQKEGPMPTVSQVATINLKGFDRNKGRYREVGATSPMKDRLALVHGALRAYALTHNFEEMEHGGHKGFVGRVNVSALIRELFAQDVDDEEKVKALAKSIQNGGDRAGLTHCVDSGARLQGQPSIWWVASSYEDVVGHPPLQEAPPAAPAKKAAAKKKDPARVVYGKSTKNPGKGQRRRRKPPQATLDRMYRVKSVLEDVGTKYDTALTYSEIQAELKAMGVEASYGQVETAVDLLVAEKQAVTRQMSAEDKAAIRAAGGDAPSGIPKVLVALRRQLDDEGNIPVLLGTLDQLKATEGAPEAPRESTGPVQEPGCPVPVSSLPEEPGEPQAEPEALEERVRRQTEETLQDMYAAAQSRADRLQAENDRLRRAVDGLLATIEILKG